MQPLLPQSSISVLIIARPGRFRDGLTALVSAIPSVGRIYQESTGAAALKRSLQDRPGLVLWDGDLPGEDITTLLSVQKHKSPHTVNLVLLEDVSQEAYIKHAGADDVLIKGTHAEKLLSTIEGLISRPNPK